MSSLNNNLDEPKRAAIKGANIKMGNSFCLGEKNSAQDERIDVTSEDFLNKLTPALSKKIKEMINAAEQQAQNIISAANAEGQALKEQAQQQGMQEGRRLGQEQGYKDGFAQASAEISEKGRSFDKLVGDVLNSKDEIYRSGEGELLEFVIMLAEKLACSKLEEDEAILKNIIAEACSEIRDKESLKILVHPFFANKIYSISEELKQTIYGLSNIKIIEDKTISEDGVVIESVDSRVDARLSSRVDILMQKLKEQTKEVPILEQEKINETKDAES